MMRKCLVKATKLARMSKPKSVLYVLHHEFLDLTIYVDDVLEFFFKNLVSSVMIQLQSVAGLYACTTMKNFKIAMPNFFR